MDICRKKLIKEIHFQGLMKWRESLSDEKKILNGKLAMQRN